MSGEFDVTTAELRTAAQKIRTAVTPMESWICSSDGASATSFGHDELAAVYVEFASRLSKVVSATATGDDGLAGALEDSAASYDQTDTQVASPFSGYSGGPGGPTGSGVPFAGASAR